MWEMMMERRVASSADTGMASALSDKGKFMSGGTPNAACMGSPRKPTCQ